MWCRALTPHNFDLDELAKLASTQIMPQPFSFDKFDACSYFSSCHHLSVLIQVISGAAKCVSVMIFRLD